ncbi:S-layer homology domain-containing protein (plasmid) [Vallitalea pronyensis]|uniref:S-layer homology domain-containing protein n=1 Tax=Vallitalea pronyensis TaxID=1348613 RepID=A0A8J8MR72_9FIRM|nr:S-layer homology domain-containing protein [Vallitalea pronyensis]QUI25923.1 S-layer homology domain-containing protein [Vallitalea pronyensis]
MKKTLLAILIVTVTMNVLSIRATTLINFKDVPLSHWAKDNISKLVSLGVVNGYPDSTFKPSNNIHVDAFIKLTVKALGHTNIKNGDAYWAENYINKALDLSIIEKDQFDSYKRPITREEMASITAHALGYVQKTKNIERNFLFIQRTIKDFYNIADKYLQDVIESYYYGLLTGKPNGFDPKGLATRAEAVTLTLRLIDESYRKPIYIPPTVTEDDIKKDQDGKMFFDVIRFRDYKNEDDRIATEIKHQYRVYECPSGETTALQLMYALDKVYKDNTGYVHLGQSGKDEHPLGVGYYCLDSIEHSYDPVEYVRHSEVSFGVKHSKHDTGSSYNISLSYKTHDMTYEERFYKYEKMFDTMLWYLYEDKYQVMKEKVIEILQLAENMDVYQYNYTIKMNDREMYVEMNQNHSVRFYISIRGGKVDHYYPVEENAPDLKKKAPNFRLQDIDGEIHDLVDYEGKKVYLRFWVSWCSYCIEELDEINSLAQQENDFVILTIVPPGSRNEKSKEEFIKWFNNQDYKDMIVLLDADGEVFNTYNISSYPTSVYIDSDGMLVHQSTQYKTNTEIKKLFEDM